MWAVKAAAGRHHRWIYCEKKKELTWVVSDAAVRVDDAAALDVRGGHLQLSGRVVRQAGLLTGQRWEPVATFASKLRQGMAGAARQAQRHPCCRHPWGAAHALMMWSHSSSVMKWWYKYARGFHDSSSIHGCYANNGKKRGFGTLTAAVA